jgi:hypothetical protein
MAWTGLPEPKNGPRMDTNGNREWTRKKHTNRRWIHLRFATARQAPIYADKDESGAVERCLASAFAKPTALVRCR